MKKNLLGKKVKKVLACFTVLALLTGCFSGVSVVSEAKASKYEASFIQKLEGMNVDYKEHLNSSVVFALPEGVSDNEEISVIITVDEMNLMDAYDATDKTMSFAEYALESKEADGIRKAIAEDKAAFLAELDKKNISYKTGEDYDTVISGFEIRIKAGDFEATCMSLGKGEDAIVSEEYETCETEVVENEVNVFDTGIFNSGDSGYDGTGMVVAVLDTGLDTAHTAFSTDNFKSDHLGLTYDDVAALVKDTSAAKLWEGLTVDDVYVNEKVPFGFDYADEDPDVYSTHNEHGTHVAGVIVGKDDTITGVAPNAQVVPMKIFSDVVDTARSTWILSALEDCVVLGVDVINMSIGTACGFSRESDEEKLNGVYDKLREKGISMVVAASNSFSSAYGSEKNGNLGLTSNPDTGTVGSPSTYDGVLSVASISGVETPYIMYDDQIIYFIETTNGAAEENDFVKTLLKDKDSVKMEFVLVPGVGRSADYTGLDVKGKIALVRRGQNTFEEKAVIAQEQGAAGLIIYNNVSGDIKMNVGDATLACCSISQDDGEMLAKKSKGKIKISKKQTSGPFISDFSSWGPTPDLQIKPEITAHGGSILSSVTGGSYDRLSGTSMACPNLAGVVILLKQYIVENFPKIADDPVKVTAMAHSLMMSTADIAIGKNGLPYSVRKQGAGLVNLYSSIETPAYIMTYDEEGKEMDKAKLELGDDPEKTGVYEMTFSINNFGKKKLAYELGSYVLTEGVSETKTNAGETTITEESYALEGAKLEIISVKGGKLRKNNNKVVVKAGKVADVTVKVTLTKENKEYLNKSFENGMYVEGFLTLEAKSGTDVNLNVPYLAYYGDWTVAPLFDLDYYATNADELDEGIDIEDKVMADAYATRPIGGVYDDYVSFLGSYYFLQDPDDMDIPANRDHISLSNKPGTIHSLRYVWAGLLRNAQKIEVDIVNDATGETIFETEDLDVRKSYGDGGSTIYPANVEIEFDTQEYNLANNSEYTVKLQGYLDYGEDGGLKTNENNTFEFPITIDFEAPTISNVSYRYEYDKTLKKNRLYADVEVYDNHYAMAAQLGYVTMGTDEDGNEAAEMKTFEQYLTPIYSERNSTTVVTYELTDYVYLLKEHATTKNSFVITCYDYALNYATYEIGMPDDFSDFYLESLKEDITLSPNEVYTIEPLVYPTTEWAELLEFASSRPSVARIVNNKIVAVSSGKTIIRVQDPTTNKSTLFEVTVLAEGDEGFRKYDKPVADIFRLDGYKTTKAYYMVNSDDKKIGDTGSQNFFEGNFNLTLYPSESVLLNYTLDAYYPNDTTLAYESSNESIVKVDEFGNVTGVAEGFASVTVKVLQDGKSTYYSQTVSVEVKDPYVTTGASLTHYYGNGGLVDIPSDLHLTEIGNFAFSNFEYVMKTEEELAIDDKEISKQWFIGDTTVTKVVIPEGVKKIGSYAFANLTGLEEIVLPSTLQAIEYGAFYGCTSLKKITFSGENNLQIINQNAFENCAIEGKLELSSACVISDYAFAGNQKLEEIVFTDTLLSIGQYAFAGCKKLAKVTIGADKVKYGAYAFTDCEVLTEFEVNASVIPEGMFYQCDAMTSVTIGKDVKDVGVFAFRETDIENFTVVDGNKTYKAQTANYIISADGKQIVAVSPKLTGDFTAENVGGADITTIAKGAFSHNQKLTSVTLPNVTAVGEYGLASNKSLKKVVLGELKKIDEYAFFEASIEELPKFTVDTKIGKYAFSHTKLKSVIIPDKMVVEEGVFSECIELKSVKVGNDVKLGNFAFSINKDHAFDVEMYKENGTKYFYYVFSGNLKSLTIGDNVVIGENAFAHAAALEKVTLGANAEIQKQAFYNNCSLKSIDLSKVKSIGDYAFSGDVYYVCLDENMQYSAISKEGTYIYTYHGPQIKSINLASVESIGAYAFSYCREMTDVKLNEKITELPEYAFAGCISLQNINLDHVTKIGNYTFIESGLKKVELPKVTEIGEYAFVTNKNLETVTLNEQGVELKEGVFSDSAKLTTVHHLDKVKNIGDYAFAYTAMTAVDLTSAISIGKHAFMKRELTPFKVTFGDKIEKIGDNPFAMCDIGELCQTTVTDFNGKKHVSKNFNYEISKNVSVIDGALYCKKDKGLELIAYGGINYDNVQVADDTIRITALAFAGTDVVMVKMPYKTTSIGHKAFYKCNELETVAFGSHTAPIFEEEFDPAYYETLDHLPGTGNFGEYTDYNGDQQTIIGMGLLPYFMWNVSDGMYSNVFYGATFVDYIGFVKNKLTMIRPVNGVNYDSYICSQYFDFVIDGPSAPDKTTVTAIDAIRAIPERVSYDDKALVSTARAAYEKIATTEQLALVSNYADLVSAEQRIKAFENSQKEEKKETVTEVKKEKSCNGGLTVFFIILALVIIGGGLFVWKKRKLTDFPFWKKNF